MTKRNIEDRREALEDDFFRRENEQRLAALRAKRERDDRRQALADATSIHDESTLDRMMDAGFRAATWHAIALVPLCEVAWADREISPAERRLIMTAAEESKIEDGSEAFLLVDHWLSKRPPASLRAAWRAYVGAVRTRLQEPEQEALRRETLDRAERVARATDHLLGFGRRINAAESRVLEELASAL